MNPGRFIALEGGEGVGKSTQARLLAAALTAQAIETVLTREPGGTPGAEAVRELLLGTDAPDWNPRAEALLFAAARSDHVERLIRPALLAGRWIVCDRFLDSSRAYQGGASGLSDDEVMALHRIGSGGLVPDLTVLIEIAPGQASARLALRDSGGTDRIGAREPAYHARVAEAFARLAEAEPSRFCRVDGHGTAAEVHRRVFAAIAPLLGHAR